MTVTEQPRQNAHHPTDPARPAPPGQSVPVAAPVGARLEQEALGEPAKVLLKEAPGDGEPRGNSPGGRIHPGSVAVARVRGIGPHAWIELSPGPGVDPVVGRNGSAAKTARRTDAVRSHLCPGCHSHQYEIGPAHDRVRTWRTEAGEPVGASTI